MLVGTATINLKEEQMRQTIMLLIILTASFQICAQEAEWYDIKCYDGPGVDRGREIFVDESQNIYITGRFEDSLRIEEFLLTSNGYYDIFIAKYDPSGECLWVLSAGGTGFDEGMTIDVDSQGFIYLAGLITGPGTAYFGTNSVQMNALRDIFISRITPDGQWDWITHTGSSGDDMIYDMKLDHQGNIYVSGQLSDTASFGSQTLTSNGRDDALLAKLDTTGNWIWAQNHGTSGQDCGYGIDIGADGNIYSTGYNSECDYCAFLWITEPDGNEVSYSNIDGTGFESGYDIEVDDAGNIYLSCIFEDNLSFDNQTVTCSGSMDAAIIKLDSDLNCVWIVPAGGTGYDRNYRMCLTESGRILVSGHYTGYANFGESVFNYEPNETSFFIAALNSEGDWSWIEDTEGQGSGSSSSLCVCSVNDTLVYMIGELSDSCYVDDMEFTDINSNAIFWGAFSCAELNAPVDFDFAPSKDFAISNYPNPFNPETRIEFSIPSDNNVKLEIFNIKGQKINTLVNKFETKGNHSVIWNGKSQSGSACSSGIYFYRLTSGNATQTHKMIMMK